MNRQKINLISATASIIFALQAFIVVLLGITTGWDRGLADEGPAAHIFQLLIVAQATCVLIFLTTADWKRLRQVVLPLTIQAAILVVTFATGKAFKM